MKTPHLRFTLLMLSGLWLTQPADAQIGMGGSAHPSAALDVKSTSRAFYPPRLTSSQRKSMASPQPGAMVFDTDQSTLYLYDGGGWLPMAFQNSDAIQPTSRVASDGEIADAFGGSVSLSGNYAIVGATNADFSGNDNHGAAYIFVRSNNIWTQQAKLTASDGTNGAQFGCSVSISGDYAVVGARLANGIATNGEGAAYVFLRSGSTWTQQAKITASDGAAADNFGVSVALAGSSAIIGADFDDVGANADQGSAYVFVRSGSSWSQQVKHVANDGAAGDQFGFSVALADDYAVIGAPYDDTGANVSQGAGYVFIRAGNVWALQAKLTASDPAGGDRLGYDVSASVGYALLGAPGADIGTNASQGAAYVFLRSAATWNQHAKLTASDGAANDQFGTSVALDGPYALIGSPYNDVGETTNQGSAYLFGRLGGGTWTLLRTINDMAPANAQIGSAVAAAVDLPLTYVIGVPNTTTGKVLFGVQSD